MQRRHLTLALALATSALWPAAAARAQSWPDKPVRFVLSQPAGSGPDAVARLIAERLSKSWGQTVWIENKPGGQNIIGAQTAAHAPADGSTLYFATTAALVTNEYLFKQLPYDPKKDFVPVAFVARSPFGLLVEDQFAVPHPAGVRRSRQGRAGHGDARQRRAAHLRRHDLARARGQGEDRDQPGGLRLGAGRRAGHDRRPRAGAARRLAVDARRSSSRAACACWR